jgi:hypothetical protein
VKLNKFYIADHGAGTVRSRDSVARSYIGVGRLAVDLTQPAGRKEDAAGFDADLPPVFAIASYSAGNGIAVDQQIGYRREASKLHIG